MMLQSGNFETSLLSASAFTSVCTTIYRSSIPSSSKQTEHFNSHKSAVQYAISDRYIERQKIFEPCAPVYTHYQVSGNFHQSYKSALQSKFCIQFVLLISHPRVMRFERYDRRRVVVRRGHVGTSMYFIFYGLVGVTTDFDGSSLFVTNDPILLSRGKAFGEMALLQGKV